MPFEDRVVVPPGMGVPSGGCDFTQQSEHDGVQRCIGPASLETLTLAPFHQCLSRSLLPVQLKQCGPRCRLHHPGWQHPAPQQSAAASLSMSRCTLLACCIRGIRRIMRHVQALRTESCYALPIDLLLSQAQLCCWVITSLCLVHPHTQGRRGAGAPEPAHRFSRSRKLPMVHRADWAGRSYFPPCFDQLQQ